MELQIDFWSPLFKHHHQPSSININVSLKLVIVWLDGDLHRGENGHIPHFCAGKIGWFAKIWASIDWKHVDLCTKERIVPLNSQSVHYDDHHFNSSIQSAAQFTVCWKLAALSIRLVSVVFLLLSGPGMTNDAKTIKVSTKFCGTQYSEKAFCNLTCCQWFHALKVYQDSLMNRYINMLSAME